MLTLIAGAALAQPPPCDEPPKREEVVKCDAETAAAPGRKIDLSALLGSPAPKASPSCHRTMLTVVSGSSVGVQARLDALEPALEGCAERARARTPKLTGAGSFELTVDGQGRVSAVSTTSATLTDRELAGCFERVFAGAHFTPAARVVRVGVGCKTPAS